MPHVPTVDIRRLGDIRFDTQLEKALAPSPDYDVQQWLFVPNEYTEYRYILGTRGKKPLICIGINPSTARPGDLDPTLKSVERVAKANGFDSFIMFNVYAQRATSPDDMEPECNPELHRENMRAFAYAPGGGLPEIPPDRPVQQPDGEAVPEHLSGPDGREEVQRLRQQDLLMALTDKGGAAAPPLSVDAALFTIFC